MDLFQRAKAILISPKTEWAEIGGEPGDARYLFANYVARLAAIPPICGLIGAGVTGRLSSGFGAALLLAIICYGLTFFVVYLMAAIADGLAPSFGGVKSQSGALKLVVYAKTPVWLAGVFALAPDIVGLEVLALYAIYLFWLGAPAMMKTTRERTAAFTAAVVVCGFVIYFVLLTLLRAIFGASFIAATLGGAVYLMM